MEKSQLYVAKEPYMRPDQIVAEYQQAKNKRNQITIIAEENALASTEPIIQILLAYGALTNPPKPKHITWGRRHSSKRRKRKPHPLLSEMKRLRKQGLSYSKIAEKLGLSCGGVYYNLETKPARAQKNSLQCTTTAENAR